MKALCGDERSASLECATVRAAAVADFTLLSKKLENPVTAFCGDERSQGLECATVRVAGRRANKTLFTEIQEQTAET